MNLRDLTLASSICAMVTVLDLGLWVWLLEGAWDEVYPHFWGETFLLGLALPFIALIGLVGFVCSTGLLIVEAIATPFRRKKNHTED
jgi:hypothetical protein